MQNFNSLASTQTDLDTFLTIFEENSRIFQEYLSEFKTNPNLSMQFYTQPSKTCSFHIFDHFSRKIQDFLKENLELSKSEKVLNRDSQKASFTKF
jgi:hypothetical protein